VNRPEQKLIREAIEIIEEERDVWVVSYEVGDGVIDDLQAKETIARYDAWLERAKRTVG
jgi:hypothetical protein